MMKTLSIDRKCGSPAKFVTLSILEGSQMRLSNQSTGVGATLGLGMVCNTSIKLVRPYPILSFCGATFDIRLPMDLYRILNEIIAKIRATSRRTCRRCNLYVIGLENTYAIARTMRLKPSSSTCLGCAITMRNHPGSSLA